MRTHTLYSGVLNASSPLSVLKYTALWLRGQALTREISRSQRTFKEPQRITHCLLLVQRLAGRIPFPAYLALCQEEDNRKNASWKGERHEATSTDNACGNQNHLCQCLEMEAGTRIIHIAPCSIRPESCRRILLLFRANTCQKEDHRVAF
jgi:hypothetical protein